MNPSDDNIKRLISFAESGLSDLEKLIRALPERRHQVYQRAQSGWDSVVRSDMMGANQLVIDALAQMLEEIAAHSSVKHFGREGVKPFLDQQIQARFDWHQAVLQAAGVGGRELDIIVGAQVIKDVERMVEQLVEALSSGRSGFNYRAWRDIWRTAA